MVSNSSMEPDHDLRHEKQRDSSTDQGLVCWLQVVGSFCIWTNTWGLCNAYGQFQTYYEDILPNSPSQIAWIGSLQSFFLLFTGLISGLLFDAGFFNHLIVLGNVLVVLGMMLTSICKEYWQIIVCQGLVTGLGFGLLFTPGVSIIPQYFQRKRQFANGIAAVGSGLGGVIYPIILHRLAPRIGFQWAVRVVAFMALFFGITAIVTLRNKQARNIPSSRRRPFPNEFFCDLPIIIFTFALFFMNMASYIPAVYISSYSLHYHITNESLAFYLVPILQASNIVGRVVPNYFADKTGPINMTIPMTLCAGIMAFVWIAIKGQSGLLVFAVLYGVFFGTILALTPGCVASLVDEPSTLGVNMGMSFGLASFGVLIGTPIAGIMLGNDSRFLTLQAFTGGILVLATVLYAACRISKVGLRMTKL